MSLIPSLPPLLIRNPSSLVNASTSTVSSTSATASSPSPLSTPQPTPLSSTFSSSLPFSPSSPFVLPQLHPPPFFSCISRSLYRSTLFDSTSFSFVESLRLRTLLCLSAIQLPASISEWANRNQINIQIVPINIKLKEFPSPSLSSALSALLDSSVHPLLVCCQPSDLPCLAILVGCFRRLEHWSFSSIMEEFERFQFDFPISSQRSSLHRASNDFTQMSLLVELFDQGEIQENQNNLPEWFKNNQMKYEKEMEWIKRQQQTDKESKQADEEVREEYELLGLMDNEWHLTAPGTKFDKKLSLLDDEDDED
jgi:hypothetical protein